MNLHDCFSATPRRAGEEFASFLFWRCLYRRAVPLVPLLRAMDPDYFAPDRELIARVARVQTMRELGEELRDFSEDSRNRSWLRRFGRVRLSTRRVRRVARAFLAEAGVAR